MNIQTATLIASTNNLASGCLRLWRTDDCSTLTSGHGCVIWRRLLAIASIRGGPYKNAPKPYNRAEVFIWGQQRFIQKLKFVIFFKAFP